MLANGTRVAMQVHIEARHERISEYSRGARHERMYKHHPSRVTTRVTVLALYLVSEKRVGGY